MKHAWLIIALTACSASHPAHTTPADDDTTDNAAPSSLYVYDAVLGGTASDQYAIRVRTAGTDTWNDTFAQITRAKVASDQDAYWDILDSWSNTYVNFETSDAVDVEVSRVDGTPISKAAAHPAAKASAVSVTDGKAYVTLPGPCQIALDIDGQMDDQDTGLLASGGGARYSGPPIHTVTVFANPLLQTRPDPTDPSVYTVQPGTTPPDTGAWTTLYFLPGIHQVGLGYVLHASKSYYIPGDAVVHGTFHNHDGTDTHDIHVFGYGTITGEDLVHPDYVQPPPPDPTVYGTIYMLGARNTTIEGVTIIDPAYHAVIVSSLYTAGQPTTFQWLKILGWRKNGDGINPFNNGLVQDSFIRTQDDGSYANGLGIHRVVYWNDANGSAFVLSALPNSALSIDDNDIIYARAWYNKWSGGRIFNMRGMGGGAAGAGVVFSNIRLEDTRPTLQAFFIAMADDPPYLTGSERTAGALSGVVFRDISLAASSIIGEPDILWGSDIAPIQNLTFDNLTIGGAPVTDAAHFQANADVTGSSFQ